MTDIEAQKLIVLMTAAWPDGLRWLPQDQQDTTLALYRTFLSDLPYDAGDAGIRRLIASWRPTSAQRWPSIAELRSAIALQQHGRLPTGGEVWGAIHRLTGRQDANRYEMLEPTIRAALEGLDWVVWDVTMSRGLEVRRWRVVVGRDVADATADRARFIDMYDELTRRRTADLVVGQQAPQLPAPREVRRLAAPEGIHIRDIVRSLVPASEEQNDGNLDRGIPDHGDRPDAMGGGAGDADGNAQARGACRQPHHRRR
ncbi:MAG TPA: hypothetical protein VLN57_20870 [Xanthobacteraceae bacterium]|nr:hypothetical protein [Xanthobacteraceae bacterium]